MMALLAIGTAMLMTVVGAAIGGLAIELLIYAMSRSLRPNTRSRVEQAGMPSVIHLTPSDNSTGAIEWVERVAA